MNDLTAKPLKYLIALEQAEGDLVEVGYDAHATSGTIPAKYCNTRDEKDSGRYAPYLPPDDIESEYGEPAPDPNYPGFWNNLHTQLDRAVDQGFHYVELDNLDTYDVDVALKCFDSCAARGLEVFVKNPMLVLGEPRRLLEHAAAVLVIVEESCGAPAAMNHLRSQAGKPNLPIRFVSYGDDNWARDCANIIRLAGFVDMGVTHSPVGEYASSENVLVPIPPSDTSRPTVAIITTGDVLITVNGVPV
jgi:hypothetical protein